MMYQNLVPHNQHMLYDVSEPTLVPHNQHMLYDVSEPTLVPPIIKICYMMYQNLL